MHVKYQPKTKKNVTKHFNKFNDKTKEASVRRQNYNRSN